MIRKLSVIGVLCVAAILPPRPLFAAIPQGFEVAVEEPGVTLYKKDYPTSKPDYVLVVDLGLAQVRSLLGAVIESGFGKGSLGGDNPTFKRESLSKHWVTANAQWPKTVAVINGQFFNYNKYPTALAFPVKAEGQATSDGYGTTTEFPGEMQLMSVDNPTGSVQLQSFYEDLFTADMGAPEMVAGLHIAADKNLFAYKGRTFVGVQNQGGESGADKVFFFISKYATQNGAAAVLATFGATSQMMMDGGSSSQMIFNANALVTSNRKIPHSFVIIAQAAEPPLPPENDQDLDGFLSDVDDCNDQDPKINPAAKESCDGEDNNCNKLTDEGFNIGVLCETGVGECLSQGVIACVAKNQSTCNALAKEPSPELCDFLDNDCDGLVDEDLGLGEFCEKSLGGCVTNGVWVCHPDSGDSYCTAPTPQTGDEVCNGTDDDCDGEIDEGFQVGQPCGQGEGNCAVEGFITCDLRGTSYCKTPEPKIQEERCDGKDNDCDGDVDEGFALGQPCQATLESCKVDGVTVCNATGLGLDCESQVKTCPDDGTGNNDGVEDGKDTAGTSGGDGGPTELDAGGNKDSGCYAAPRPSNGQAVAFLFLMALVWLKQGERQHE